MFLSLHKVKILERGIEPLTQLRLEPKPNAYANFATPAGYKKFLYWFKAVAFI